MDVVGYDSLVFSSMIPRGSILTIVQRVLQVEVVQCNGDLGAQARQSNDLDISNDRALPSIDGCEVDSALGIVCDDWCRSVVG